MSSGFQEIAAALGVAELALRSIFRVYEFLKYMKDAPESVARLCTELFELKSRLAELALLDVAGSPIQALVRRLEISATVNRCGDICSSLESSLQIWTRGGRETLVSRFRVRCNKSQIEAAIQHIASTKDNIILAVSIASLYVYAPSNLH